MAELIEEIEQTETSQLVEAAQLGDRQAFGQLFERFQPMVMAVAFRRLHDVNEAQELTQDVFIQAMTKLDQLREPERFAGWLRSITHRMAINRVVRRGPTISAEPATMEARCVEYATPLTAVLNDERHSELRAGLGRLRNLDRETLEAFYVKGHSLLEMSDEFAAPLGTIKRRLHVARQRLAKEVEPLAV